jgi:hypothetical protein
MKGIICNFVILILDSKRKSNPKPTAAVKGKSAFDDDDDDDFGSSTKQKSVGNSGGKPPVVPGLAESIARQAAGKKESARPR